MATFVKAGLSGSTNGKQIKITSASNPGITIHTATSSSGANTWDEVWLYAYNDNLTSVQLTILWGGTTEPDNAIRITLPPQTGRTLICDGMILQNSLVIKAYASVANEVMIDGFVNNIS